MPYKVCGTKLTLEGMHSEPILILSTSRVDILEKICSYLNQLDQTHDFWKEKTKQLLMASLDGKYLNQTQDAIAKMFNYPGLEEFIKEVYTKDDIHKQEQS